MAIIIVAIVTAIGVPTYKSYRIKANRADAITSILSLQMKQERYRLTHDTYGALADFWGSNDLTPDEHYKISFSQVSGQSYQITATAEGSQADDTDCNQLVLTYDSGKTTKSPGFCWGLSVNTATP